MGTVNLVNHGLWLYVNQSNADGLGLFAALNILGLLGHSDYIILGPFFFARAIWSLELQHCIFAVP